MKTIACKIVDDTVIDMDENGKQVVSVVSTIYPSEPLPECELAIFDGNTNTYNISEDKVDMDIIKTDYPSLKIILDKQVLVKADVVIQDVTVKEAVIPQADTISKIV